LLFSSSFNAVTGRSFTLLLLSNTFFGISSKVLTHVYRVACRSCSFRYVRFRDECKPHPNTPAHTYLPYTHTHRKNSFETHNSLFTPLSPHHPHNLTALPHIVFTQSATCKSAH
jgi:hypothetical protein